MKTMIFAFVIFFLSIVTAFSIEVVDTAWVRRYNGPGNDYDFAEIMTLDVLGNPVVTGRSEEDFATIKYYPNGDTAWIRSYNGPGNDYDHAFAIATDTAGNVYVSGCSWRYNGSLWEEDYATIKYYSNGDVFWSKTYNGPGSYMDRACAITSDGSGDAFVTGYSAQDSISPYNYDYATIKYYSDGDTDWVRRYNGPGDSDDRPSGIAVDGSGNVYVTGASWGSGTHSDYATIKYNPDGDTTWVRRWPGQANGADYTVAIVVDDSGNIYVTGYSYAPGTHYDYATIKYFPNGDTAWVRLYNGPGNSDDRPSAIALDGSYNVYITGYSAQDSLWPYNYDHATIKYYPDGDTAWVRRYNGIANVNDYANSIAVDSLQNVYVTGGADVDTLGEGDYLTIKYRPNGEVSWIKRYNGSGNGNDNSLDIAVDFQGSVYVTGGSYDPETDYDYATIKYIQYDSIPFAPPVCYESGDFFRSVFCADLDNDEDLDLAMINRNSYMVSILRNNGNAMFGFDSIYAAGFDPVSLFCAELDGDGDLDIAVGGLESDSVSVLKNNGDGTFQSPVNYGTAFGGYSVFCADLDGDTDFDLAVVHSSNTISILKNNGDGTFQVDSNYAVGADPFSVFCCELDGDAYLDLAVANRGSNNVSILNNNQNGSFQGPFNYGAGSGPNSVFCGDLDGDTDLDLAVANFWGDNVSILKNNGYASFDSAVSYGAGDHPVSVFCADLDGDTHLDLAVANLYSDNISILKNNGDGSFQTAVNYEAGNYPNSVFCADLDADGDFDLAVATSDGICILENLTQAPANQPPWAFSLISPSEGDTTSLVVDFDWQSAYDPNFGDQIRNDLYISTSPDFDTLNTIIDSNLIVSRHTDTLAIGTYYWKVKAKDNWGAYTYSLETDSFFNNNYISDTLFIIAYSPVDLIVTDPIGDSIGIDFNTIPGATYDTTTDWNGDGDNDDIVTMRDRLVGEYKIRVIAEPGDSGTYDLGIKIDGGEIDLIVEDHPSPPAGAGDDFCRFCDIDSCYPCGSHSDVSTEERHDSPEKFALSQNYPNPFNLSTKIEFTLPKPNFVTLKIYDLLGRKTRTLVSEHLSSGHKSVVWDGKDDSGKEVASGIYFYQLKVGDYRQTKKLVLLK